MHVQLIYHALPLFLSLRVHCAHVLKSSDRAFLRVLLVILWSWIACVLTAQWNIHLEECLSRPSYSQCSLIHKVYLNLHRPERLHVVGIQCTSCINHLKCQIKGCQSRVQGCFVEWVVDPRPEVRVLFNSFPRLAAHSHIDYEKHEHHSFQSLSRHHGGHRLSVYKGPVSCSTGSTQDSLSNTTVEVVIV